MNKIHSKKVKMNYDSFIIENRQSQWDKAEIRDNERDNQKCLVGDRRA